MWGMMKNRNEMKSTSTECSGVGLGLKMQAESSEFEKTRAFPFINQYLFDSAGNSTNTTPSTAGGRGFGPFFWDMLSSNQPCGTAEIYATGTPGGGGVAVSEKALFTASQLHELQRQQMIHKYMLASIPVPHELMLPISRAPSSLAGAPQFKEPWRCRRTDGKKWRCTRNAAAEQRYCERHSHKNKTRSRKHVEPKTSTQSPTSLMAPGFDAMPYDQARGVEWCKRGGSSGTAIPISTCDYRQQMQQISSRLDSMNRDNTHHQKNVSRSPTLPQQDFKAPVPNRFEFRHADYCNSPLPSEMTSFQENYLSLNSNIPTHTTPQFIDAWEQEGIKGLSPSSLTLSMSSSSNRNDETNVIDRRFDDSMGPGGPLGEALCLGNASISNWLSPNDYNYTSSSCEDGSHAFKFIR
ncbi:growth-regulating factor 8-like [Dorcoceras hygrometricum]|uniref:Growth-regulating factor n=1 Tax=Dorcoceras hygrometricum TaxID=472368 RepID=A0A2Z7CEY3_9LAMI|nr:growth-regulating factor 8-like [Dorcoceras hygrometricum]